MKLGYTLPEIQDVFQELIKNKDRESNDKSHVLIGGKQKLIEVYEVPLDLPRYRLSNTRTIAMQEQYIADNDLDEDYFEKDPLSDTLQEVQHNLLKKLIDRKDLKKHFKKEGVIQTFPLILTHEGFVISGNRRLCTFRELYYNEEKGKSKYKHYQRVRVVILPKMTDEEIEYIEDHFEQEPKIRDEFTWTNKALGFERRLKKHKYSVKDLADKTSVKQDVIEDLLNKLKVAREYLEFIGKPKLYDLVESDEFAFRELLKTRKKFVNDPARKDIFQKLSFIALKNSDQITDRMYKNIPYIKEEITNIQSDISNDFSDEIEDYNSKMKEEDPFYDADDEDNKNFAILSLLNDKDNEEELFSIVLDKVQEHKMLKQEKERKQAVIKRIQKAHKELLEAYNIADKETKKEGINEQLINVESVVDQLREWLKND